MVTSRLHINTSTGETNEEKIFAEVGEVKYMILLVSKGTINLIVFCALDSGVQTHTSFTPASALYNKLLL